MKETVSAFIKRCEMCCRSKYERQTPRPALNVTENIDKPFQKIHMDTFMIGGKIYLTCIDAFTKFAQAIHINSKNAVELVDAMITYFSMYGIPEEIVMDGGTEFTNELVKELMYGIPEEIVMDGGTEFTNELVKELLEAHKIKIHITTPYNPNSNGCVERLHSTLIEHMRILKEQHKDEIIEKLMKLAIIGYNNTIHSITGLTPLELTLGHTKIHDPFDVCYDKVFYNNYLTRHANRLKLLYENLGPYEVKQVNQDNTAVVTDKNQKEKKVHIQNLKYGIVPDSLP
ncbi:hypothetical protein QE152_g35249 [Popillia japonica]|uniref:Integrase catalytic domain-containing protein n=1 Tax=Popillia japonica TaxID=7064 RepID=A0AAW1IGC6_POPJA